MHKFQENIFIFSFLTCALRHKLHFVKNITRDQSKFLITWSKYITDINVVFNYLFNEKC